jgi:hypothetical protein
LCRTTGDRGNLGPVTAVRLLVYNNLDLHSMSLTPNFVFATMCG